MHTNPEVLALLALGEHVADPADSEHLVGCPVCRAEIDSLSRLIEQGRQAPDGETLHAPSESVWAAIQSELGFIPVTRSWPDTLSTTPVEPSTVFVPQPPRAEPAPTPIAESAPEPARSGEAPAEPSVGARAGAGQRRGRRALALVLAAALALVAGIAIGVGLSRAGQPQETVIGRATLTAQPQWPGATGTARVVEDSSGNRILYVDLQTSQAPPGNQQVWLADPTTNQMKPMGWLNAEGHGFWTLPPGISLTSFPVIDVSDEPADDNGLTHSGDTIVRGELQR